MTAILPVNDQYRIELDQFSWQVSKWEPSAKHPKGGRWRGKTWHRTFEQAAQSLLYTQVSDSNAEGLNEVLEAIRDALGTITTAIQQNKIPDSWLKAKEMIEGDEL